MDTSSLLLVQGGVVLALMVVLALLKHRTRKTKLNTYTRRMARRSRYRPIAREVPPDEASADEPSSDRDS